MTPRHDFVSPADYSPETHRLEMERLWPRVWQMACREEEIPKVGDYVNYEIGHESILIVRNAPGSIKAFYNVCPHRGRRLRDDARGRLKQFFCGYHAWTFDLDGQVLSIPGEDDWKGCPQFGKEDVSLAPVKCDTWAGWVWINMDPDCEPLHQFLAPLPEKCDVFEWENCRMRWYQTIVFPVNWKVVLEAFIEGYHARGTHPQLLKFGDLYLPGSENDIKGPYRRHGTHTGYFLQEFDHDHRYSDPRKHLADNMLEQYETLHGLVHEEGARAARRLLTELPEGVSKEEVFAKYFEFTREEIIKSGAKWPERLTMADFWSFEWQIFPNSSVLVSAESAFWYRMRPNGDNPDSAILDVWSLGRFAPGKEPNARQEFFPNPEAYKGRNPILEQDFANMIAVHKGMRSRGWKGARPNPIQESNVHNFHRVLHEVLFGEGR